MPEPSVSTHGITRPDTASEAGVPRQSRDLIAPTDGVSPAEQVFFPFVTNRSWYTTYWYQLNERPRLVPRVARYVRRCMRSALAATRSVQSRPRRQVVAHAPAIQAHELPDAIEQVKVT
jgi:hypothetical protein